MGFTQDSRAISLLFRAREKLDEVEQIRLAVEDLGYADASITKVAAEAVAAAEWVLADLGDFVAVLQRMAQAERRS